MSSRAPYLQRRADTYSFRISVPLSLRRLVGAREITRSLRTTDKGVAASRALRLAATVKETFRALHAMTDHMTYGKPHFVQDVDAEARRLLDELESLLEQVEAGEARRGELFRRIVTPVLAAGEAHGSVEESTSERTRHARLEEVLEAVESDVFVEWEAAQELKERVLALSRDLAVLNLSRQHHDRVEESDREAASHRDLLADFTANMLRKVAVLGGHSGAVPTAAPTANSPTLGRVVDQFLEGYQAGRKSEMFKKHLTVLPMFREFVGPGKAVSTLKQADINEFFALVQRLPPRWKDLAKRRRLSVRELAQQAHPVTVGPKTFDDTYKACIRAFLKSAKKDWQDQGFPTTLVTDGIEYSGPREADERKQRAFRPDELKRLFEGPEMRGYATDATQAHCYWFPLLGLFTGARVNELCQLNPGTDIVEEEGAWCLWITPDTEGDDRISKRTKTKGSRRKVPIHSKVLELGFLGYVASVKRRGAKLLFPAWKPGRGKASAEAEKWFRRLLADLGLRDETPGECLLGMHAFRHTLMNRAKNLGLSVEAITGHAEEGKSAVVRGYEGELSLSNKKRLLDAITFDIEYIKPMAEAGG